MFNSVSVSEIKMYSWHNHEGCGPVFRFFHAGKIKQKFSQETTKLGGCSCKSPRNPANQSTRPLSIIQASKSEISWRIPKPHDPSGITRYLQPTSHCHVSCVSRAIRKNSGSFSHLPKDRFVQMSSKASCKLGELVNRKALQCIPGFGKAAF